MQAEIRRSIISGEVAAPPSAPMAHRALLLSTLTPGQTAISNLSALPDISSTIAACRAFGADIVQSNGVADVFGPDELAAPLAVDCGDCNTALKLFLPLSASFEREVKILGSLRLSEKDLSPFFDFLSAAHAETTYGGSLPAGVKGPFSAEEQIYPGQLGSQFLSGILLCAPLLGRDTSIGLDGNMRGWQHVKDTVSLMKEYGIEFHSDKDEFLSLPGGQAYSPPDEIRVPASAYLSSFLLLTGALSGKATLNGSCDWQFHDKVFQAFGAGVTIHKHELSVSTGSLSPAEIDAPEMGMFLPHALVLASVANGKTMVRNLHSLPRRYLLRAQRLCRELGKMGAKIEREGDSFAITGGRLAGAKISPGGDPAVAMACAAAAVCASGPTVINESECVSRAYPNFFRDLASLGAIVR
jgi:3-phosphoshikimate 1-carboxyvinyltransferase